MRKSQIVYMLTISAMLGTGLTACEQKGPAERAGEKIDEAAQDIKEDAGKAAEDVKEAAADVKEQIED
jgi:predicted small lipoprotein YifL